MTNIINFPRLCSIPIKVKSIASGPIPEIKKPSVVSAMVKILWVFTVLIWPIIQFVLSIDCALQFVRMIYQWNTSGVYAGGTFILHFMVLTVLTYFVSIYKPNEI